MSFQHRHRHSLGHYGLTLPLRQTAAPPPLLPPHLQHPVYPVPMYVVPRQVHLPMKVDPPQMAVHVGCEGNYTTNPTGHPLDVLHSIQHSQLRNLSKASTSLPSAQEFGDLVGLPPIKSLYCLPQTPTTRSYSRPVSPRSSHVSKEYIYRKPTLFFARTRLDEDFILKHIALNADSFDIDIEKKTNQVEVTEDDILCWLVEDFLSVELKLHDRRKDVSPLIHDLPQNRFDVEIEFCVNKSGVHKVVCLQLTLLKSPTASWTQEEIAGELGRLFSECFTYHQKSTFGRKRKRLRAKPQWGLGSDNELVIIDMDIAVKPL